jgi:hypothetical protein
MFHERRINELAKGLGVSAEWGDLTAYPGSLLNHLPGIHTCMGSHWLSYQPLVLRKHRRTNVTAG